MFDPRGFKTQMSRLLLPSVLILLTVSTSSFRSASAQDDADAYDVVIYGGTSAAVVAAVQVKRMGKTAIIVCPDKQLGGLSSGGLGWTDTGNKAVIGGLAREFYHRIWQHYQTDEAWKWQRRSEYGNKGQGTRAIDGNERTMWIFEPHVAENVFEGMIREFKIPVHRDEWLDRDAGVHKTNGTLTSIRTLSGKTYAGRAFIDATYEGDLMAATGVDYHVGRESSDKYGEEWNGVQTGVLHHRHHFGAVKADISPYVIPGDPTSGILPRVSADPPGEHGAADKRIQAYCFRTCLTNHPDNRVPFPKPEKYDPAEYELLLRIFDAGWRETFDKFDPIPNRKTDTNNHGPMSSDNIGRNYDYPDASYARRKQIISEHEAYQKGWYYFIANDPRVPKDVQDEMKKWGLAKDEFPQTDHWPHQLYVREARRMVGEYVMTENEVLNKRQTPEPVGMGSYAMDSHNVQRYITPDGFVQNEGDIGVRTNGAYQISYRSLTPKRSQCKNLLVPVCVSSSHIAFGSIRMEPVFMILGQSAATAAVMALEKNLPVQDLQYADLRERLLDDGQVLESKSSVRHKLAGTVVDDEKAEGHDAWKASGSIHPYVGKGYRHDNNQDKGQLKARYSATLEPGTYEVRLLYQGHSNRASNVPVVVHHVGGTSEFTIDQRKQAPIDDLALPLGKFKLNQESAVVISNAETDGYVVIDAVQFVPADSPR